MAEENNDLPIEELGIDLVVNAGDSFISDMSKAGKQMTTFSGQIGRLVNSLPMLNLAMQDLSTQLSNINNRVSNVKKVAGALDQLGKMPNTVKNIGTNAANAAAAVDKLYTSLESAQARMRKLRSEESAMRLEMQREQGPTKGSKSTGNVTGPGTKVTRGQADAAALARFKRESIRANLLDQAKSTAQKVVKDSRFESIAVPLKLDLEEGKIGSETKQVLLDIIRSVANESRGQVKTGLEELGANVAGGLTTGMAESEEAVIRQAATMAQHLLAAIADTLQTHSPSKVTIQRGKDVGGGLAEGVTASIPAVEAAGKAMGEALLGAIDGALDQLDADVAARFLKIAGSASELGGSIRRKSKKISDEAKQMTTRQGPLNDRNFDTTTGLDPRIEAAYKASQKVTRRADQVVNNVSEAVGYLQSLDPETRQALEAASKLRVARKITSNRGENILDQGAIEDSLLTQMKLAGAEGTAPGTESLGSQKVQSAYVPALGKVARWKKRGGAGVSMGHNAGKRDFTGALYQQKMQAYADQGGLDAALLNAKPGTPEWKALEKGYSPVTTSFPWQPQPARTPKGFTGDKERLEQAASAAAKYIIKAMGLDKEAMSVQHKRLGSKEGTAQFNKLFDEMPEMKPFRDINARDAKQYLREQMRVGIDKQRVADKQGDPQIEQATSAYYQKAHEIIGRQDATLSEIISGLEEVNNQIKADLRAKFETTQEPVFKMLSERDDPVISRTIAYLKKFGDRQSTTNPGKTIAEVLDAWAGVWDFLKEKFGGQQGASEALSAYENYVNKIETPALREDLMPEFPANLQVRRVRGAPRQIDKDLAVKRRTERLAAERDFAQQQHYKTSRIRNAVDFGDTQGSRKIVTKFEQQKMQAQVPDSAKIGVDREKVLEASNAAVAIEWELKAQEDAINKAAEAYAKKNGRTLAQVNQAVENVRSGKNTRAGKALTDLAKMIAEYDRTITRWEEATDEYVARMLPAQQAASKSIGKGIAKGELRSTGAKYFDAEGKQVNPEGMNVRTRNLKFVPGGLVRGADGKPQTFDTSTTQRQYQPEMLGATAIAAYAPAYKKPRGYRAPEITDKERIRRANRAAEIQAELGGQYNAKLGQTYGGFKPPTKKAFAGDDLEKAARIFGEYSRDFNELLRIKTSELGVDVKTALDSINTAANNYIGSAIKYVDSFKASGFLEKGAAEEFNAALLGAQASIIDLKNRASAGEKIKPADVKAIVRSLHERVKEMGMFMEASTQGLDELEKAADKAVADEAAAAQAKITARQAGGWQAVNSNQARGWRAANGSAISSAASTVAGGARAAAGAAQQAASFVFPDDWVVKLVNAIGQAADRIVAAVRGIRIELKDGGVAENVGPTEAQKKAGRRPQTDAERVRDVANVQADLIRTSEVDAYRASHTAMRQVRQASDLNPNEVKRLQQAIDAWRAAAIKDATDSIRQQADRGSVVDAFRASRSQADLDLQKIVGPQIRQAIQNQESAVGEREMRTLETAFDDIARAERNTITALQKSGAPAQQLEKDMKAISAAAELAREDVMAFSQSAESFQILDAQVDQVVNGFREMGEQAKFAARQADRTPLMQKQLAVRTRADSITRDAERLKADARDLSLRGVPQTEIEHIIKGIDQAAADATHELAVLLNEARAGGVGANNSMAAFNLQLQKIRSSASEDIDVLRRLIALTKQNAPVQPKTNAGAGQGTSDVDRAIGAKDRAFKKAATLGMSVADEPYANQKTVAILLDQLVELKAKTDQAVQKALAATVDASGSERANAVREAIDSTKAGLDGITDSLRNIAKVSRSVTSEFQKIDHAAADTRGRIADLGASGRARIDSAFASSLAVDLDKQAANAARKFEPAMAGIKTRLAKLYADARQAAMVGDKAAVSQLVWEIRKLTDTAEAQVDASLDRILARADQIDRQVKGIQQIKDWAKDPQSFLQERVVGNAKKGGVTGWINRARINFQEADATAEMFKNVQKAKLEMNDLDVVMRTLKNTVGGVFYGISGVFKLLTAPIWAPIGAGIAIFKGLRLAIDGVSGAYKKLRYMIALPGKKKEFAAGLNEDDRGQRYAETYANYTALFEKMNRTSYNKATAGKKFFATPGFDKASMDRQAKDFGSLQAAYDKLQKAAVKQGMMDRPVTAVGRAAAVATAPVRKLADVLTLGASSSARETKKLNAEMARAGTTAEAAGVKVKRSGLFGAKIVSTQPRQANGRFAGAGASMGFNDIVSPATQANAKRGMKKLFADMGTGVGLGFGMSFSMGIVNAIQGMAWRIQSTIGGVISNGMTALIETEMRKMTIQSFVSQDMIEKAGPSADFGQIWTDAKDKANDYYKQIVDIAKISSFSRSPLLDLFGNMQVGGLSADNAASVTRAVTMFGDAFMPGNKQMVDTFGQQMSQMLNQGVAQQVDLKLLAQQGIPVYDMLAKNLPRLQGQGKDQAQSQLFDEIGKGQLGATEALEAITKGMVDAASNFKGEAAKTMSGLMSTFQDLMLEKSEAIMTPVADNLMKPFIEFANDFLQSNPVTAAITAFGQQINALSQTIMAGVATAMGVLYGLWKSLPAPVQEAVKAIGAAVAVMTGLTAAIAAVAAIGALLAPMFGVITTGMLMATGAVGAFIGAWSTNLMGFRDWLTGWANWAYNWAVYLGKSLADGLLTNVGEFSKAGAAAINGFMGNFMGNMESIYASLQAFGQNIGTAFSSGLQQVGAALGQLGDWVNAAIEWLWALPQNAWDVVTSVVEAFWEVPKNLDGIGQAMWSWGENVVTMFAQGMQGAINVVFDALQAIGDMFTEWLEPGSPPKLLPDLTIWGTGAADAYLEGWTKADYGILNDLSSKLEEAFAIDEGAMKQGELASVRGAVADMVDKAIGGTVDTSGIMNAIPGWGGRAESVQRLADAYAHLAVTQHALTVEQEALDRITAQYDARLKPLQARLESIQNKQEALDLTSQIKEYQNVLDNIYATDDQKKAAALKMDELKLSQQINNTEMERDKLTDPINERIGQLTYENMLAQDNLDIATERWNVEVGMLKAGAQKDKAGGGADTGADTAGKDPKDKAAGTEKNRQFTQPKLNVPGISGKNGLGAIGTKMQELSDKIKGYFSDIGEKAKPLVDALGGIGSGVSTIKDAIDAGFTSGAFSSDKGFAGFLNNVGAALAVTTANIDAAKTSIGTFVAQVQAAWNTPFGAEADTGAGAMGPQTKDQQSQSDFGGFKKIAAGANEQATVVQRAQAVVTVVQTQIQTALDTSKTLIETFATDISTAVSSIDWVTIQGNFQTGLTDANTKLGDISKAISDFVAGIPEAVMGALGVEGDPQADPVGASKGITKKLTVSAEAVGAMVNQFVVVLADGMAAADWGTAGKAVGATIVTILDKFVIWLATFMATVDISGAAEAAGKAAGAALGGLIIGAIGAAIVAQSSDGSTFSEAVNDIGWELAASVLKFLVGGMGSALAQIPVIGSEISKATDNLIATIDATKEAAQKANLNVLQPGSVGVAAALAQQTPESQAGMAEAGGAWKDILNNPFDLGAIWQKFQPTMPEVPNKAQIQPGQEAGALLDLINAQRAAGVGPAIPATMPIAGGSTTGIVTPGAPKRDKTSDTIKSILDFDFSTLLPATQPTGVVPFTNVSQTPAWETVSTPTQKAQKAPAAAPIQMDLGGLDPAKMFQAQVTAATTAGTTAGANFSKAYSTATTTALAATGTTGKNVFTPVEKGAPESAKATWTSFLTGLQQAGGSATTQAGAQGIGTDVIGGIVQGALTTISTSPLLALVPAMLVKFFQSSLGIQSPSLVFDQMVGQPIGMGIIQGLNTVLMGGGQGGVTPQMIMDTMFLGIMNSMSTFSLTMQVGWYNFKSSITTILTTLKDEWMEVFDTTFEEANTKFDEFAANWVEEKVPEFKDALIELAVQAKEGFLEAMQEAVDGLQEKIDAMLEMLSSEDLLSEFYEKGQNLGENIADGIAAGMTSRHAAGEFAHAAEKIVDMINDAIAAAAQIESPSKVFAREVGVPISAGIAVGMNSPRAQHYLETSAGNVIEQIVGHFQNTTTPQVVTARYVRQPEENMVSMQGVAREYHMHLNVTPQMAERVDYNFSLLETMYG